MMKNINNYLIFLLLTFTHFACQEEYELSDTPPASSEATFTYSVDESSDNVLNFSNASDNFLKVWDLGNGVTGKGNIITGIYPDSGTYTVKLTVYNAGGSATSTQEVYFAQSDPTLLDKPIYNKLTGGASATEGKTWVVDSARSGHFGIGPGPDAGNTYTASWWEAGANEKKGGGLYDDRYTFRLAAYGFTQTTNGDVYINSAQQANFPGAVESSVGDYTAPFTASDNLKWQLVENAGGYPTLTISNGGFIGYYTGVSTYQILELTEDEMYLRYLDGANTSNAWYLRLIREGYDSGGGNSGGGEENLSTLPLDFEGDAPPFNGFGGSTYEVVDNPDATGINTSAKVAKYVKGLDGNWAGIETSLASKIDFSKKQLFKYKVWSSVAGKALFKLEAVDGSATAVEIFADVTKTEEWEELTFDCSAVASDSYDKIALFLDFDNNNGGTFYLDDIAQYFKTDLLTVDDLTGGTSKTWVLKPAAGSFGVGPEKGSDAYWPNGTDISGDRPCLFNDRFIFKSGGEYEYDAQGDVYAESYMGLTDGCQDESSMTGTDAEAWASGIHSFTFTPATDTEPAYITVTGTGAFIALPKAYNGGEYSAAPPTADASVKYEVLSYQNDGVDETLLIAVDITGDGSQFWNFVLIPL